MLGRASEHPLRCLCGAPRQAKGTKRYSHGWWIWLYGRRTTTAGPKFLCCFWGRNPTKKSERQVAVRLYSMTLKIAACVLRCTFPLPGSWLEWPTVRKRRTKRLQRQKRWGRWQCVPFVLTLILFGWLGPEDLETHGGRRVGTQSGRLKEPYNRE